MSQSRFLYRKKVYVHYNFILKYWQYLKQMCNCLFNANREKIMSVDICFLNLYIYMLKMARSIMYVNMFVVGVVK